jgi:hypothetical protein
LETVTVKFKMGFIAAQDAGNAAFSCDRVKSLFGRARAHHPLAPGALKDGVFRRSRARHKKFIASG